MVITNFRGPYTALVTVCNDDGSIDWEGTKNIMRFSYINGCNGVSSSTTGQAKTMSPEKRELDKMTVRLGHEYEKEVIVGTSDTTAKAEDLTHWAAQDNADATLQVVPPYVKPNQEGLIVHFSNVAQAEPDLPLVMYDVPARTVVSIRPKTRREIVAMNKNVFALKDATGKSEVWEETNKLMDEEGLAFELGAGNDNNVADMVEKYRGVFGILVAANPFPHIYAKMYEYLLEGQYQKGIGNKDRADELFDKAKDLDRMIGPFVKNEAISVERPIGRGIYRDKDDSPNPFTAHASLYIIGAIDSPELRPPLKMTKEHIQYAVTDILIPIFTMDDGANRQTVFGPYADESGPFKLTIPQIEKNIKRFL